MVHKYSYSILTFFLLSLCFQANAENLKADFSSQESKKIIYYQGFDSDATMTDWIIQSTNAANTWQLNNSKKSGLAEFSSINPESVYSASVFYSDDVNQDEKLISPTFTIGSNTQCDFYIAFDGVFAMYANLTVEAENTTTGDIKTIFDAFQWAQDNNYERHKWVQQTLNLADFANQSIRLIFRYKGIGGDDVYIDDFRLTEADNSENSVINIEEGDSIHFTDLSLGNPTIWNWTFENGNPASSNLQNPIVKYDKAGTYKVSLTVGDNINSDTKTKEGYVIVKGVSPRIAFSFPTEGYMSPNYACFIPENTEVTFADKSSHMPTTWLWNLPGATPSSLTTQQAKVKYSLPGTYDAGLTISNNFGTDTKTYTQAVKVGGTAPIWNIGMEETDNLETIDLGWYGYYGGTNWLDLNAFAERFNKPVAPGKIESVDIYFANTKTVDEDVEIHVSIYDENDGLPGNKLATTSLLTSQLQYDENSWVPTTFTFPTPLDVNQSFFVVVDGFPNRTDSDTYETDEVVIASINRDNNTNPSTAYHLALDYDENNEPLTTSTWYKMDEQNVSFAIAPHFSYNSASSINSTTDQSKPEIIASSSEIKIASDQYYNTKIYDIAGHIVKNASSVYRQLPVSLMKGIYLIKLQNKAQEWIYKVVID